MSATTSEENPDSINYIGFNQDSKVICVGHKDGYMFYKTADILENNTLTYEGENLTHLGLNNCLIIERLFSSALMVVISQKDPRVLHVYHFTSRNIICDHRFNKSVLTVRLNRDRIVVCLEDCIYIYNLKDMKMMHNIMDTPTNKLGVLDLTSNPGNALIAYPGSTDTGSVHLFDAINLSSVSTFNAHEGTIACLKFNQEGNMIATASTKGTVIRVYSVPNGHRLFEFRRGVTRCVNIYSLCFSSDSKYLTSSSNTETVHVFKLEKTEGVDNKPEASTEGGGWFDAINKTFSAYMPSQVLQVGELMTTERSFATAKLPGAARSNQVSLVSHKNQQYVMAATSDGFVYAYRLDPEGGELDLIKQHNIGPKSDTSRASPTSTGSGGAAKSAEASISV
ncbi:Autophagy-related protein 18 [Caenorhabditis elegans]|uniref:Isoform b of Autophagy-related protein 18 n=1 Tax=Caenorhabditis elegans TaxID=6239 RepID=O16466-2|nr:Autophagy-related protein 18 [Caenorhabditis elegans]CCD64091.1 Autophagy-related protein 18 [Caenorhabditis elegans]|eukprot:NP_741577.1 AuTophaGy (yeast Atg homolog) [Caenorhabditis elegans]